MVIRFKNWRLIRLQEIINDEKRMKRKKKIATCWQKGKRKQLEIKADLMNRYLRDIYERASSAKSFQCSTCTRIFQKR